MNVTIVQGNIAEQQADALVNAAGTSLSMGSGVAGALLDAAGQELEHSAVRQGPIELGTVVVTDAYDLDAEYVLHAAAMSHAGPQPIVTAESIREATQNCLRTADDLGCRSLVVPLLGCGSGGFPTREGAAIICDAIQNYDPSNFNDVRVIGYSDRQTEILEQTLSNEKK